MDQENNIDKMLYNYFEEDKYVPDYINETIHNTLEKEKRKKHYYNVLKRVAVTIITFGIVSTSVVFADDIINYITSLFTNSTEAIDSAVENGYVQDIDMEYVYDNDIGIKVDNIILDDTNLDISFIYNYESDEAIDSIELYEYCLKDENGKLLYIFKEDTNIKENQDIITEVIKDNEIIKIDDNLYRGSMLYSAEKIGIINNLRIEIESVKLSYNNKDEFKNGNWIIDIEINNLLNKRNNIYYKISDNDYIEDSVITLTETSLRVDLKFNINLNKEYIKKADSIILKDYFNNQYLYNSLILENNREHSILKLEYDISKYDRNVDELQLYIQINENENIKLDLKQ